jgi:PncC family amidohydrolase
MTVSDALRLSEALRARGLRVACAESCTGGLVASNITDIAGSSDYFTLGVVTYSEEQKQKVLGISLKTLAEHSAVSKETCAEMLVGIKRLSDADLCIATTGYAGPTGGTNADPVGTVYVGVLLGATVTVERCCFLGSRTDIKMQAAAYALRRSCELIFSDSLSGYQK